MHPSRGYINNFRTLGHSGCIHLPHSYSTRSNFLETGQAEAGGPVALSILGELIVFATKFYVYSRLVDYPKQNAGHPPGHFPQDLSHNSTPDFESFVV